jgi:DNA polymerase-1
MAAERPRADHGEDRLRPGRAHDVDFGNAGGKRDEDKERLLAFFNRYGFKTLLRELGGLTPAAPTKGRAGCGAAGAAAGRNGDMFAAGPASVRYETVLTEEQLDEWIARIDAAPN